MSRLDQFAAVVRHLRYERLGFHERPIVDLSSDQAQAGEAVRWMGLVNVAGEAQPALYCHPTSSATFDVALQPGDRIAANCALLPDVWDRNTGGVQFSVTVEGANGLHVSRTIVVSPGSRPDDRRWRRLAVALPISAAQAARVTLRTSIPAGASGAYAWSIWGDPSIERGRAGATAAAAVATIGGRMLREGPMPALRAMYAETRVDSGKARYDTWFHSRPPAAAPPADGPLISIMTPAYNTPAAFLRACVASVLAQTYRNWEWCIANDASTSPDTLEALREVTDPRIRVLNLEKNGGIALASQAALEATRGEFVALLDSDDELTPNALAEIVRRLVDAPQTDVVYSDEDKRDEDGLLSEPYFKPDWSPDHLLGAMYPCHLLVMRRPLMIQAGGFRKRCDGSQDHDILLRVSDLTDRVAHVPNVLYHWRRAPMSGASAGGSKPWAEDAGQRAVADHLERHGFGNEVRSGGVPGLYRPVFPIAALTRVLAVVLGDDPAGVAACSSRLRDQTRHAAFEVASCLPVSIEINALLAQAGARADHVVFVDASLDVADADWLTALLEFSQQDAIGAVGGKVQYADGRLRHIGLVLGAGTGVARAMHQHPGASYGYFSSAIGIRNYSAVSGELLMTRRALIDRLGGFDEALPWNGADVDYCLKARAAGLRVVFTPYSRAQLRPGATPAFATPEDAAVRALGTRWPAAFARDPYYNDNLSTASGDYGLGSR